MRKALIVVIGGGPAGLSAAIAAAKAGVQTVLLDENPTLGGQLRYRVAEVTNADGSAMRPATLASDLIDQAAAAGVDTRPGSIAWGLFDENVLAVVDIASSYQLQADRIIVATGSTDVPFPFSGGSLPGVLTARAVQLLLHHHRVRPGRRFVVLGGSAESAEVTHDIEVAGGDVVAVFDPAGDASRIAAEGAHGVHTVSIDGNRHEADTVVVAIGRQPDPALVMMAECATGYAAEFCGFVPIRDDRLHTSNPRIFATGDAAGLCDVAVALAEGAYAGVSAAASLDLGEVATLTHARQVYAAVAKARIAIAQRLQPTVVQG